ncbi:uncharacterized protein LOC132716613 [Ruditapes philippinarum]|uniref:uncharacterized protein LOC132716613 n=1 Tax=Ruditapes philippinarum TaxID=129788 RepID=UPI00295BB83E|nr:uncharacterized protein LOC132716613 [Ruditapes philippinarum]
MRINTKCLWTFTISILVSILSDYFGQCKSTLIDEDKTLIAENAAFLNDLLEDQLNSDDSPKLTGDETHGIASNFSEWDNTNYGKVSGNSRISTVHSGPDKREWSKFVTWGKRQIPLESYTGRIDEDFANKNDLGFDWLKHIKDERTFQDVIRWKKRAHAKRLDEDSNLDLSVYISRRNRNGETNQLNDVGNRKWQRFTSRTKRNNGPLLSDKRKWAKIISRHKTNYDPILMKLKKRKWATFTSWGKRSEIINELEGEKTKLAKELSTVDKRKWAKFASWGKRPTNPKDWLAWNSGGKRKWTGLTTWGKRSGDVFNTEPLTRDLLYFFDNNGSN